MDTEAKFLEFHTNNPHVYGALAALSWEAQKRGYKKWGIGGMFEILRWRGKLQTWGDEFKLRNDFRAFYARLLVANGDAPEGFFTFRTSQADKMAQPSDGWEEWEDK